MKHLISIFCILILSTCHHQSYNSETLKYLAEQIESRKSVLVHYMIKGDSMRDILNELDAQVSNFILISKDIENLNASINLTNDYFKEKAEYYNLTSSDFTFLNKEMHVDEMAIVMRQNELNLLNELIFKYTSASNTMYTAH